IPIFQIPPTQLVDRSRSTYTSGPARPVCFEFQSSKSHQRSWWIVHAQPTKGRAWSARACRLSLNNPPTALVGFGKCSLSTFSAATTHPLGIIPLQLDIYSRESPQLQLSDECLWKTHWLHDNKC